jgi:hypothetical protein
LICEGSSVLNHHPFKNKKFKHKRHENSKSNLKEGLYIYGGFDEEKPIDPDLYLLKLWCKPLQFIKIETKGKKPGPRYEHGMHYIKTYSLLVILHGRNSVNKH